MLFLRIRFWPKAVHKEWALKREVFTPRFIKPTVHSGFWLVL